MRAHRNIPTPDQNEVAYKIATVMSEKAWRIGVARPVMDTSHASAEERHCLRRGDRCQLDQSRVRMAVNPCLIQIGEGESL